MNESQTAWSACFRPVLLSVTYNEDQIKYLIQKAMETAVVLCIYVVIDDPSKKAKMDHIALSPQQVRYVWQNQLTNTILSVTTDDGIIVETGVNILGLMADKSGADYYLEMISQETDPSDMRHVSNIPALSKLNQYNPKNRFGITLSWKEILGLKIEISSETSVSRAIRLKERTEYYGKMTKKYNPTTNELITLVHTQEAIIRDILQKPSITLETYRTEERKERNKKIKKVK